MLGLNFAQFAELFDYWASDYVEIKPGERQASDGKSIHSSLTNYNSAQQDFIALVSLFSQKRAQMVCALPMHNKQTGEAQTVRQMLAVLDLRGAVVTTDAFSLRCF